MERHSKAVQDVVLCCEAIKRRRKRRKKLESAANQGEPGQRILSSRDTDRILREQYMAVLQRQDDGNIYATHAARVKKLQQMIVLQGLPSDECETEFVGNNSAPGGMPNEFSEDRCSLRGMVWKVLLGAYHMDAMLYVRLVEQGASWKDYLIQQDTFRTFKSDEAFKRRVPEEKLSRVNNAFVRLNFPEQDALSSSCPSISNHKQPGFPSPASSSPHSPSEPIINKLDPSRLSTPLLHFGEERVSGGGYVQGMTILCAPFLFIMPEVDAFFCFNELLTRHLPRYVTPNLDGVHVGCDLIGRVLQVVDPQLFAHLSGHAGGIKVFAFPLLMSLHACMPPLEETLKIWDVLFAFGVHMEVLLAAAQCLLVRGQLLRDPNPYNLLNFRYLPALDSEILVSSAFCLIPHLPQSLLDEIARHPLASPEQVQNTTKVDERKSPHRGPNQG